MSNSETEFKIDFTLHLQKAHLPNYPKAAAAFQQTVHNHPLKIMFRGGQKPGVFIVTTFNEADANKLENKTLTFYYGKNDEKQVKVKLEKMPKFKFYSNPKWISIDWLSEGNLRYVTNTQLDEFCKEYGEVITNFQDEKNEFGMLNGRRKGRVNLNKDLNIERIKWVDFEIKLEDGSVHNARGKIKIFYQGQPVYCKRCSKDHDKKCPQIVKEEAFLKDYNEQRKEKISCLVVSDSEFRLANEKALYADTNVASGAKIGHIANVLNNNDLEGYKSIVISAGLNNLNLNVQTDFDKWHVQVKNECVELEKILEKQVNNGKNIRIISVSDFPITKSTNKASLMHKTVNQELKNVTSRLNLINKGSSKIVEIDCEGGEASYADNKHFTEATTAAILEQLDETLADEQKLICRTRPKGVLLTTDTIYSRVYSTYRFGCSLCTKIGHKQEDCKLNLEIDNVSNKNKRSDRLSSTDKVEAKKNC